MAILVISAGSKFFRPKPPEYDRDKEKADRNDRIERDQPRRRHFFAEENEVGGPPPKQGKR